MTSTATITDKFKQSLIDYVYDDFQDSASSYYVGIGRAQPWDEPDSDAAPPFPTPSAYEAQEFMDNMQSMKKAEDLSRIVERYNYSTGGIYSGWNNDNHSFLVYNRAELGLDPCIGDYGFKHPFYVITASNKVYVCIKQGIGDNGLARVSSTQPSEVGEVGFRGFENPDNYQWRYLYTVGTELTRKFLTSGYIPSQRILDSEDGGVTYNDLDLTGQEQALLQRQAVPGEIIGVEIEAGGTGYPETTNTDLVSNYVELEFVAEPLIAEGVVQTVTPARAWARVIGGSIVDVTMKEPATDDFYHGMNYANASVKFVGSPAGSGAVLRPIVGPKKGIGYDVSIDLNSTGLMFNVILEGNEDGAYIVGNDFRQIGLIRNPMGIDSDGLGGIAYNQFTDPRAIAMPALTVDLTDPNLVPENITGDNPISQSTTGASGILTAIANDTIYYTQNNQTGYTPFETGPLDIGAGGGATTVTAVTPSIIMKQGGEVYYIDNREPFIRNAEQTEDIKLVMDF